MKLSLDRLREFSPRPVYQPEWESIEQGQFMFSMYQNFIPFDCCIIFQW